MKTILVVDDNEQQLYLRRTVLEAAGYAVVTAANGAEALAAARAAPPDLIVSDILMPVMDGFLLRRACRDDAVLRLVPFIFLSLIHISEPTRPY